MLIHLLTHLGPSLAVRVAKLWQSDWLVHDAGRDPSTLSSPPPCDLVLLEEAMLADSLGPTLQRLRSWPSAPEVVVFVRSPSPGAHLDDCAATLHAGLPDATLADTLHALTQKRRKKWLQDAPRGAHLPARPSDEFRSSNECMRGALIVARRAARSDSSVLIRGEVGVGKERLAEHMHRQSPRSEGPFIVINCGAIPESQMEHELFGSVADSSAEPWRGQLERAEKGTILFDEVDALPAQLQVKLMRALQSGVIQREGSSKSIGIDLRVIATTHHDLRDAVAEGRFRADLFYRLSVVSLHLLPLRQRAADILPLAETLLRRFATQLQRPVPHIDAAAGTALRAHDWPGNLHELANVLERALLVTAGPQIGISELPDQLRTHRHPLEPLALRATENSLPTGFDEAWLERPLAEVRNMWNTALERQYLIEILNRTGGKIGETARQAGIDPRSLYTKMRRHNLRKEDYRPSEPQDKRNESA